MRQQPRPLTEPMCEALQEGKLPPDWREGLSKRDLFIEMNRDAYALPGSHRGRDVRGGGWQKKTQRPKGHRQSWAILRQMRRFNNGLRAL